MPTKTIYLAGPDVFKPDFVTIRQNIRHIEAADIVMANVQDFRGHEPDSGTVFEIGYAIGRGKAVL